jgi:flagellar biogenesis protein FliO
VGKKMMNHRPEDGDHDADQRRSAALIGLIIILALAIAGVWLVRELRQKSALEDCLMSGRTNCAPIEAPSRN